MKKPRAQNEAEAEAEAEKVAEAEEDAAARQPVLAQTRKLKAKRKQSQNDGQRATCSSGHKNGCGCHHVSRQLHSRQTTFNDQNEAFLTLLMSIDGALATPQQHV